MNGIAAAVSTNTLVTSTADRQKLARLTDGAHQFEAMMLAQMLKSLKFTSGPDEGGDGEDVGGAAGTVQGMATEALSKSLASRGGFGIAQQIIRQITREDVATRAAQSGSASQIETGGKV